MLAGGVALKAAAVVTAATVATGGASWGIRDLREGTELRQPRDRQAGKSAVAPGRAVSNGKAVGKATAPGQARASGGPAPGQIREQEPSANGWGAAGARGRAREDVERRKAQERGNAGGSRRSPSQEHARPGARRSAPRGRAREQRAEEAPKPRRTTEAVACGHAGHGLEQRQERQVGTPVRG